jgi:hypothetical protein
MAWPMLSPWHDEGGDKKMESSEFTTQFIKELDGLKTSMISADEAESLKTKIVDRFVKEIDGLRGSELSDEEADRLEQNIHQILADRLIEELSEWRNGKLAADELGPKKELIFKIMTVKLDEILDDLGNKKTPPGNAGAIKQDIRVLYEHLSTRYDFGVTPEQLEPDDDSDTLPDFKLW